MVGGPAPGRWTGRGEMAQGEREFLRTFEGYRIEAEGYRERDGGRVSRFSRDRSDMERRAGWISNNCGRRRRPSSTSERAK